MNTRESIRLAGTSLRANKMRSALTLLGVVIGIAAVIAIMTLGKAMQKNTLESLEQFGINDVRLTVKARTEPGQEPEPYSFDPVDKASKLTPEMIEDLANYLGPRAKGIAFEMSGPSAQVTRGLNTGRSQIVFSNVDHLQMLNQPLQAGRWLNQDDMAAGRNVTVVSPEIVQKFFNGDPESAIGQELEIEADGQYSTLLVVGAYGKSESDGLLVADFSQALMTVPYTARGDLQREPEPGVDSIRVRVPDDGDGEQVAKEVQAWADRTYADNQEYLPKVEDTKQEIAQLNQTLGMISMVISAIGGISLLVGGIGVMNIMLITVTERTREIGVRMALGATRRAIRKQFVIEAMIVCLIGGCIGVAVGSVFGMLGAQLMKTFVLPPLSSVVISLLFALGIGLFFGWYPANKASKMNPIEALRYE